MAVATLDILARLEDLALDVEVDPIERQKLNPEQRKYLDTSRHQRRASREFENALLDTSLPTVADLTDTTDHTEQRSAFTEREFLQVRMDLISAKQDVLYYILENRHAAAQQLKNLFIVPLEAKLQGAKKSLEETLSRLDHADQAIKTTAFERFSRAVDKRLNAFCTLLEGLCDEDKRDKTLKDFFQDCDPDMIEHVPSTNEQMTLLKGETEKRRKKGDAKVCDVVYSNYEEAIRAALENLSAQLNAINEIKETHYDERSEALQNNSAAFDHTVTNHPQYLLLRARNGDALQLEQHPKHINTEVDGLRPLHVAIINGHLQAVISALENGASINAITAQGKTPLHLAVESHQQDMVDVLVMGGADLNARDRDHKKPTECDPNNLINTALETHGHFLESAIRQTEKTDFILNSCQTRSIETSLPLNEIRENTTPLIKALAQENIEQLRHFLELGADPNITPNGEKKPLLRAIEYYLNPPKDVSKQSVLPYKMLKLLLKHEANPNITNLDGAPLLHLAIMAEDVKLARLLIEHGADLNVKDAQSRTPLDCALNASTCIFVDDLLAAGATEANNSQDTRLAASQKATFHFREALEKNDAKRLRFLAAASKGKLFNTKLEDGFPLEICIRANYSLAFNTLLLYGANPTNVANPDEPLLTQLFSQSSPIQSQDKLMLAQASINEGALRNCDDELSKKLPLTEMVQLYLTIYNQSQNQVSDVEKEELQTVLDKGLGLIKSMIRQGVSPAVFSNTSLLYDVIREQNTELLELLLLAKMPVDKKYSIDHVEQTPLTFALNQYLNIDSDKAAAFKVIEIILNRGIKFNADVEFALLEKAIKADDVALVRCLLLAGFDPDRFIEKHEHSPLDIAINRGHQPIIDLLVAFDASQNSTQDKQNTVPNTRLNHYHFHEACRTNDAKQVEAIFAARRRAHSEEDAQRLLNQTHERKTPIECSIEHTKTDTLETLLRLGANPNLKGANGTYPLHGILKNKHRNLRIPHAKRLVEAGADPHLLDNAGKSAVDYSPESISTLYLAPIYDALSARNIKKVGEHLKNKALTAKNALILNMRTHGTYLLHKACQLGEMDVANSLSKMGAQHALKDVWQRTAAEYAKVSGSIRAFAKMISRRAAIFAGFFGEKAPKPAAHEAVKTSRYTSHSTMAGG
jgi:ankyrin repeat protein